MSVKHLFSILFLLTISISSHALVDMRNANYSDTWTDMQIKSSSFDLRVQRMYQSRSLFNGIFGFGWCSEFESKVKITAENTIRTAECGAGFETVYSPANYNNADFNQNIQSLLKEIRKVNKGRPESYYTKLESDLRIDPRLREEFAKQFNLAGKVKENTKYIANNRISDYITLSNNIYSRHLPNGSTQSFNKEGDLIKISDKNGNFIKINHKDGKIVSVVDNTGASLQFKYHPNSKYVAEINGPGGLKAAYKYSGENLIEVVNAWKNKYVHAYDDLYNLTKLTYPDKTFIELTYNKDRDWVTSFRDRRGCKETYAYLDGEKDPVNNYSSKVEKLCDGKVTNRSEYEFWHREKKDGTRYLARSRSVNNGKSIETSYDEVTGRPLEIIQDGIISRFEYYPNGLLRLKTEKNSVFVYKYENPCNKVSQVTQRLSYTPVIANTPQRKPTKTEVKTLTTQFLYDTKRCNLMSAKNSFGQFVNLKYDIRGRISQILDQSKKEVLISYEERFGKPHVVSRPGLGTISFKYKADGTVEKFESDEDPVVAIQVASIFSNLLEIIAPATTDTNNI